MFCLNRQLYNSIFFWGTKERKVQWVHDKFRALCCSFQRTPFYHIYVGCEINLSSSVYFQTALLPTISSTLTPCISQTIKFHPNDTTWSSETLWGILSSNREQGTGRIKDLDSWKYLSFQSEYAQACWLSRHKTRSWGFFSQHSVKEGWKDY